MDGACVFSAEASGRGAAVLLGGVAVFQVGLAAGAPWGAAAWGGLNRGELPKGWRVASGAAAVALGTVAVLAANPGSDGASPTYLRIRPRVLRGSAAYLAVGTLTNAACRSRIERWWAPVNAAGAVLLWCATQPATP